MARERRSTLEILGRLSAVVSIVTAVHFVGCLIHSWGFLTTSAAFYTGDVDEYGSPVYSDTVNTFWFIESSEVRSGWFGIVSTYIAAALLFAIAVGVGYGLFRFAKWLIFKPQPRPHCRNGNCRCTEHKGMKFDTRDRAWYRPGGDSAISLVLGMAVGLFIGSSVD